MRYVLTHVHVKTQLPLKQRMAVRRLLPHIPKVTAGCGHVHVLELMLSLIQSGRVPPLQGGTSQTG